MRIVLAYSGGLQMSAAIPWLADTYRAEVVTMTLDLGVGADLETIRDRALSLGATRAHVMDVREAFARDYVARALGADATLDDGSPLLAALSQAAIARSLVEIAHLETAGAVAHGAVRHDLDRLEKTIASIDARMRILAPARDRGVTDADTVEHLLALGVPVPRTRAARVNRSGALPEEPAFVDVTFDKGVPTAVNGIPMPLVELMENLGMLAAAHRVRPHETAFAAAAFVLHAAHRELPNLSPLPGCEDFLGAATRQYVEIIQSGGWFSLLREALDAFVERIQGQRNGTVRFELFRQECRTVDASVRQPGLGASPAVVLASV